MSSTDQIPADEFVRRFRSELIPLNSKIQWFSAVPLGQDERGATIEDPLHSLPPRLVEMLPRLNVFLVPCLKSRAKQPDLVVTELPGEARSSDSFQIVGPEDASILVAGQDLSGNEVHYSLFAAISSLAWEVATPEIRADWAAILKDELGREVHGEVDEMSWVKKNALVARQSSPFRDTKLFRDYVRASFIDTLTLFLHGICCDIDVEPSPRQAPSREIRRRLEKLRSFYPLGNGFVLFPEEMSAGQGARQGRRRRVRGEGSKAPLAPVPANPHASSPVRGDDPGQTPET